MKKQIAVIELASNELRLKIGEKADTSVKTVDYLSYPVTLGRETFHNGKISFETIEKICEIIKGFLATAKEYGVKELRAIATTSIREAKNKEYILDQIKVKTGVDIEVLDENSEKTIINRHIFSMLPAEKRDSALFIQLGSGNINIFIMENGKMIDTSSVKIGALRINELFEEALDNQKDYVQVIREYLIPYFETLSAVIPQKLNQCIVSGNEIKTIASMCNATSILDFSILERETFTKMYKKVKEKGPETISMEYDMTQEEAEVLLPSIIVLNKLIKYTSNDNIMLSNVLLSDAVMFEMLFPKEAGNSASAYEEFTLQSARNIAAHFGRDLDHISRVSSVALEIYDKMKKLHGYKLRERTLLHVASILQDIGKFVNVKDHAMLSYNSVTHLDIVGINDHERKIVAAICYYHNGSIPNIENPIYGQLSGEDRVMVSKLAAILQISNSINTSHSPKFEQVVVNMKNGRLNVYLTTLKSINLEKWAFISKSKLFREVYGINATIIKRGVL